MNVQIKRDRKIERKKDWDAVELHVTTCVVTCMIEWYHFVGSQGMMRKKIVKAYMYIRILIGPVFTSHRKKASINMLIKVCFSLYGNE